ncbi:MAG: DUF418 domain-containing protein [Novosphingobium sp.]
MTDGESPAGNAPHANGRIVSLDYVRGVAVLGILFANIVAFSQPMLATVWPGALPHTMSRADEAVWLFQYLFIDGKMRGLFTLLFGAGMVLFVDGKGAWLQVRRLFWLALFGLAHFFLLFRGDILFTYALCGMVALPWVRLGARQLLVAGALVYAIGALFSAAIDLPRLSIEGQVLAACPAQVECLTAPHEQAYWEAVDQTRARMVAETDAMQSGFQTIVRYTWQAHRWEPLEGVVLGLFETVPLMLLGMGLMRAGFFAGRYRGRTLAVWGLGAMTLGVLATLPLALWVRDAGYPLYRASFAFLGPAQLLRLPTILGMAACLVALSSSGTRGWLGERLVASGRMAFSNYLGTSLLMAFLFQGWGLGRFGEPDRVDMLRYVLGGWIAMLAWSKPWLARFRYGPLEWLWRCLVYGRIFPLRR